MHTLERVSLYNNYNASAFYYLPQAKSTSLKLEWRQIARLLGADQLINSEVHCFQISLLGYSDRYYIYHDDGASAPSQNVRRSSIHVDSWHAVHQLRHALCSDSRSILALINVEWLGSLFDPRPLLAALKTALLSNGGSVVFAKPHVEKPVLRNWKLSDLIEFLAYSGFEVGPHPVTTDSCILLKASVDMVGYNSYLAKIGPTGLIAQMDWLLVTTEDASLKKTGGIGTYVANAKKINQNCLVLFAQQTSGSDGNYPQTLIVEHILGQTSYEQIVEGDGLIEAVRIVLYTFPFLKVCEFQDYLSIGFRLVQAKKAGGLPEDLRLRVYLHGNHDYIRHGSASPENAIQSVEECKTTIQDTFVFANADETRCPSRYLERLMAEEYGYFLKNCSIQPYPFDISDIKQCGADDGYSAIEELVFIGKYMSLKGWPDFVDAINELLLRNHLTKIRKVTLLAPSEPPPGDIAAMSLRIDVEAKHVSHGEMLQLMEEKRKKALFVVPSGSENYPNVFIELVLSLCRVVGYRSGGAVEVVDDDDYLEMFFCAKGASNLAQRIRQVVKGDPRQQWEVAKKAGYKAWARQRQTNAAFAEAQKPNTAQLRTVDPQIFEEITLATPVFNTPLDCLRDLAASVKVSSVFPHEWIIVDDGSSDEYRRSLQHFVESIDWIPTRLISQKNKGLAGARNTGLREAKTELVYFVDSDDLLLPHSLAHAAIAMCIQPEPTLAVSGFAVYFESLNSLPKDVGY
jgi:glycosyltransferase involved in cell wall biosynthesis